MPCEVGDQLVLRRVRGGWFTTGTGKTQEQADEESDRIFGSGMTQSNDVMVVQVVEKKEREFDSR